MVIGREGSGLNLSETHRYQATGQCGQLRSEGG